MVFIRKRGLSQSAVQALIDTETAGDVAAAIAAAQGDWDFIQTFDPSVHAVASIIAGTVYGGRLYVPKAKTVTQIGVFIGANASTTIDVGLASSTDLTTWTKLASSGAVNATVTNDLQWVDLTAPYALPAGSSIWAEFVANSNSLTAVRTSTVGAISARSRTFTKASGGIPLPASLTSPTVNGGALIWLAVR